MRSPDPRASSVGARILAVPRAWSRARATGVRAPRRFAVRGAVGGAVLLVIAACGGPVDPGPGTPDRPSASIPGSPTTEVPATGPPSAAAPGGEPAVRPLPAEPASVAIPGIGVRSDLLSLGLTPDGAAEVPADFARAGWFRDGGRPGGRGPTVLLGHVDSADGPAVFYRLRDLRPGDVVEVTAADGTLARYAVERTEQVAKDEFPTFAVFGATPDDVLRLVTCAGEFDRGERSYTDNLVVHTRRV